MKNDGVIQEPEAVVWKKSYLVLVPLNYCFSIPFFNEFIREFINEKGNDVDIDILLFGESEPSAPDLFFHPAINRIEVGGAGKARYVYFLIRLISLLFRKKYKATFFVSQFSMLLLAILPNFRYGKKIYLNDEIWELSNDSKIMPRLIKCIEKNACRRVDLIVTQDKFRGRLVKLVNGDPAVPFLYIPNSRKTVMTEDRIIPKMLGVGDNTTVLLWSGAVSEGDGCLDVARLIAEEKSDVCLLLHFRSKQLNAYKKSILQLIDNKKVFYVDTEFDYDDLDQLYKSADVGICPYPNRGVNARSIYYASGKINSFLANGVPVITSDFHGLRWISKNELGVCVRDLAQELIPAVQLINEHRVAFCQNALDFHRAHLASSEKWRMLINGINDSV